MHLKVLWQNNFAIILWPSEVARTFKLFAFNPQHNIKYAHKVLHYLICLSVTILAVAWHNSMLKLRYDYLQCRLFLIFAQLFCSEVI